MTRADGYTKLPRPRFPFSVASPKVDALSLVIAVTVIRPDSIYFEGKLYIENANAHFTGANGHFTGANGHLWVQMVIIRVQMVISRVQMVISRVQIVILRVQMVIIRVQMVIYGCKWSL
jgi:hypothetical protein